MGEAKRRRASASHLGGPAQYCDLGSGELRAARDGGDLEAYLASRCSSGPPSVPCKGCATCCYHEHVDVDPEKERPEDLPYLLTEPDPEGGLRLQHRSDGGCIHLGDNGCTIYEHRPNACRMYDCRIFTLFGVLDGMGGGRHTPMWVFDAPTQSKRRSCNLPTRRAGCWRRRNSSRRGKTGMREH